MRHFIKDQGTEKIKGAAYELYVSIFHFTVTQRLEKRAIYILLNCSVAHTESFSRKIFAL
jgi:hypothetical protein